MRSVVEAWWPSLTVPLLIIGLSDFSYSLRLL